MSSLRDVQVLTRHYAELDGFHGLVLLADRLLRRLPPALYRMTMPALWPTAPSTDFVEGVAISAGLGALPDKERSWFADRFPQAAAEKVKAADQICEHVFEFLGTGPQHWGAEIDWHRDVRSGHRWRVKFFTAYRDDLTPGRGADVKIPWELSRLHHFVTLAQAWCLTRRQPYADELVAQWEHWLQANPWLHGVNWTNAMEVSIRAVNLLWATTLLADAPNWTDDRRAVLAHSLWQHGSFIEHNLEVGVRDGDLSAANHYLTDACGLACLGLSRPDLPGAARWQRLGLRVLEREMQRQVLPDGVFFESSTAYHRLALECFLVPLLAARRRGIEMSAAYRRRLERMCDVILYLAGPDGCVPQIGDNDDGRVLIFSRYPRWPRHDHRYLLAVGAVLFRRGDFKAAALGLAPGAASPAATDGAIEDTFWMLGQDGVEQFDALASDPAPLGSRAFPDGGLYVIRSDDHRDYALIRTAASPPAPTAHAHNDALSVELWVDGEPVFVDSGTSGYTADLVKRNHDRSAASHNTAVVDGAEINRMPGGEPFRLMPDAAARVLDWQAGADEVRLVAEHTGYLRLARPVLHRRTVRYEVRSRRWIIDDELVGGGPHTATWHWHCRSTAAPEVRNGVVQFSHCDLTWVADPPVAVSVRSGRRALGYGHVEPTYVLVGAAHWTDRATARVQVEPARVTQAPVGAGGGPGGAG